MKRRFRRSWYALAGASKERLGFSDFYGRTGHALVNALNTHDSSLGLARYVHQIFSILRQSWRMFEFKRGGFSKKSSSMLSPAHVFPLPPMNWKERNLSLDVCEENEFLQCLYYCGNLIVSGTSGMVLMLLT